MVVSGVQQPSGLPDSTKPAMKAKLPKNVRMVPPVRGVGLQFLDPPEPRRGLLHEPPSPASTSGRHPSSPKPPLKGAKPLQPAPAARVWQDATLPPVGRAVMEARMLDVISKADVARTRWDGPPTRLATTTSGPRSQVASAIPARTPLHSQQPPRSPRPPRPPPSPVVTPDNPNLAPRTSPPPPVTNPPTAASTGPLVDHPPASPLPNQGTSLHSVPYAETSRLPPSAPSGGQDHSSNALQQPTLTAHPPPADYTKDVGPLPPSSCPQPGAYGASIQLGPSMEVLLPGSSSRSSSSHPAPTPGLIHLDQQGPAAARAFPGMVSVYGRPGGAADEDDDSLSLQYRPVALDVESSVPQPRPALVKFPAAPAHVVPRRQQAHPSPPGPPSSVGSNVDERTGHIDGGSGSSVAAVRSARRMTVFQFARSLSRRPVLRLLVSRRRAQGRPVSLDGVPPRVRLSPGVRELFSSSADKMAELVTKAHVVVINMALSALGASRHVTQLTALLAASTGQGRYNEHTHACAFVALHQCRRPDLVLNHFENLCKHGVDIGPVGASALIKLCAMERDLATALDIFNRLVATRTTLNRWTYNGLAHLCGVLGRLQELEAIFAMMRKDPDPGNRPDSHTYASIVRCIMMTKRWDLLTRVYDQMVAERVSAAPEVWCYFITAAARANKPELAQSFFDACVNSGMEPNQHIFNALLAALSKTATLEEMMALYRRMIAWDAAPDAYTFNALFTTCARVGTRFSVIQELVVETRRWGVRLNTHLGTSLVNTYRHTPEMTSGDPAHVSFILEQADDVLSQLCAARMVNSHLFTLVGTLHAQAGDREGMVRLLRQMHMAGLPFEAITYQLLARACADGGLAREADQFSVEADRLRREANAARRQQALGGRPMSFSGGRVPSSNAAAAAPGRWSSARGAHHGSAWQKA